MNILKYLLISAATLPAFILAGDSSSSANPLGAAQPGFSSRVGEQVCVNVATAVAIAAAGYLAKRLLGSNDQDSNQNPQFRVILERDAVIANTKRHIHDLRELAAHTDDTSLAKAWRKQAEEGERILARTIALRDQELTKLHGSLLPQSNKFEIKVLGTQAAKAA